MSGDWMFGFVAGMWAAIGLRDLGIYLRRRREKRGRLMSAAYRTNISHGLHQENR